MSTNTTPSVYDFTLFKFTFTDEPRWYRIVLISIGIGFVLALVWLLKKDSILLVGGVGVKKFLWGQVSAWFKGRSP